MLVLRVPTLSIFIRKRQYEDVRKATERTGKTIGYIVNKLIEGHLKECVSEIQLENKRGALRSAY